MTTYKLIKVIESKTNAVEHETADFFNTEEPLNLSHELYLDNEKTGNISNLEKLTIKESGIFEGLPYVCEDDTLEDDKVPQYIYDATDKKWITVNESWYITDVDFFNTEEPLNLSHKLLYHDSENIYDYNRTAGTASVVMGYKAEATGDYSTAIGWGANAMGENSTALGSAANAMKDDSIAFGYRSEANGDFSIAMGRNTTAIKDYSIAVGTIAKASEDSAIAIGNKAKATKDNTIALGRETQATNYFSIALGYGAQATGNNSIALGLYSKANGSHAIALGNETQTIGNNSIALGNGAIVNGDYSIILGDGTGARGNYAIALGNSARTSTVSKYALGGFDENKQKIFNLEEITYSQYGNKKYLIGLGGYNGTNLTVKNNNVETLNPDIKSVQEIINGKVDLTPIVTSTDATISLQPNKKYEIIAGDTLVLTFTEPSDKTTKNEYLCSINIGASVPTITFPKEIIWDVEPVIAANKHYEINVQYSQGKYWGTIRAWEFPNDEVVLDETE